MVVMHCKLFASVSRVGAAILNIQNIRWYLRTNSINRFTIILLVIMGERNYGTLLTCVLEGFPATN